MSLKATTSLSADHDDLDDLSPAQRAVARAVSARREAATKPQTVMERARTSVAHRRIRVDADFAAMTVDERARYRDEHGEAAYQAARKAWLARGSTDRPKTRYEEHTADELARMRDNGGQAHYDALRRSWITRGRPRQQVQP